MPSSGSSSLGRLFPELSPCIWPEAELRRLAALMWLPDDALDPLNARNLHGRVAPGTPAGYVHLGQFINHDLALEPSAPSGSPRQIEQLFSLHAPRLDLEVIYGGGLKFQPYLFGGPDGVQFRLAESPAPPEPYGRVADTPGHELPRLGKTAVVADERTDISYFLAQIALIWMRFHNALLTRHVTSGDSVERFAEARRLTTWHYQRVIVDDFLRKVCRGDIVDRALEAAGTDCVRERVPVEFLGAAFRFGHSMVRSRYNLNAVQERIPLERILHLTGRGGEVPVTADWLLDWRRFFDFPGDGPEINLANPIDAFLTSAFRSIALHDETRDVVLSDLLRGNHYRLPSGQDVALALNLTPLSESHLLCLNDEAQRSQTLNDRIEWRAELLRETGLLERTPLFFYLLREAYVEEGGLRLGSVGSSIVAGVIARLLASDPNSYLRQEPDWSPTIKADGARSDRLAMCDIIEFAGPISPVSDPDWPA